jgi:hypothetical protein
MGRLLLGSTKQGTRLRNKRQHKRWDRLSLAGEDTCQAQDGNEQIPEPMRGATHGRGKGW